MEINEKIKIFFIGLGSGIVSAFSVVLGIILHNHRMPVTRIEGDLNKLQDTRDGLQEATGQLNQLNGDLHDNTDRFESILRNIEKTKH